MITLFKYIAWAIAGISYVYIVFRILLPIVLGLHTVFVVFLFPLCLVLALCGLIYFVYKIGTFFHIPWNHLD